MDNPFSHSGIVTGEAFCNREKELEELVYKAANSQNTLLYSHRRMGKTSLIHQLIEKLKKHRPKVASVYIDLYGSVDEKDFIEAVFSGLAQIESNVEKLLKLASGLKFSMSVDPMTGQPSFSVSISPVDRAKYLDTAMNALSAYSIKNKLLVIFDEFQEIANYSSKKKEREFEKRLRSHIQLHKNIAYIFCGSQKHILSQMFNTSDRAFYQMATSFPLKPISMDHYIRWAGTIFKNRGIDLNENIIRDVVKRCDFQPMYIQQFLFELWRIKNINADDVDKIELKILQSRENEFIILWDSLTNNQRKAVRLISQTGGEGIYYSDALQQSGIKSGSFLQRALEPLTSRGIVTKNKVHHIQDAMFKKWIQRVSGT